MSTVDNGQDLAKLIRSGALSQSDLQAQFNAADNSVVSIDGWNVCFNSGAGEITEFATITATNPSNPITGVGMILYRGNSSVMYAVQYSNGFSTAEFATSVATMLYSEDMGTAVQGVIYGWTEQSNFFFTQNFTVSECS